MTDKIVKNRVSPCVPVTSVSRGTQRQRSSWLTYARHASSGGNTEMSNIFRISGKKNWKIWNLSGRQIVKIFIFTRINETKYGTHAGASYERYAFLFFFFCFVCRSILKEALFFFLFFFVAFFPATTGPDNNFLIHLDPRLIRRARRSVRNNNRTARRPTLTTSSFARVRVCARNADLFNFIPTSNTTRNTY